LNSGTGLNTALDPSHSTAPHLKRLIVSMIGNFSTQQVVAAWKNLVSLTLDAEGSSCENYVAILEQSHRLESCVIGFTCALWPGYNNDLENRLHLHWLGTFTLIGYTASILFLSDLGSSSHR
jgi:hypothetical protein